MTRYDGDHDEQFKEREPGAAHRPTDMVLHLTPLTRQMEIIRDDARRRFDWRLQPMKSPNLSLTLWGKDFTQSFILTASSRKMEEWKRTGCQA